MKRTESRNRFSSKVHMFWQTEWHDCMVCHMNTWSALHHINCPSVSWFIDGKHNESILNSCPIHNYLHPNYSELKRQGLTGFGVEKSCHVGNEAYLYEQENAQMLMWRVRDAVSEMGYELNELDREFIKVYSFMYEL